MKTQFTLIEIVEFMQKKKDQIIGEEMIFRATNSPNIDNYNIQETSLMEGINRIHSIGLSQGKIEGKVEMMNDLIAFFEL